MNLFQILAVGTLVFYSSSAQLFPFSNLRAFFDPKTTQGGNNNQSSTPESNVSRPHRQTDDDFKMPSLQEFDSPDIFAINRDINNHRSPPLKRLPASTESTTPKPKRKGSGSRYHSRIRTSQIAQRPVEEDSTDLLFITPKPNSDLRDIDDQEELSYSKTKSKSITRERKPFPNQNPPRSVEPVEYGTIQINTGKEDEVLPISSVDHPSQLSLPSEESRIVQNIPLIGVNHLQNSFEPQDELIDYLVPPKLPSVYERNLKRQKLRNPTISKLKPPPPTPYSKKNNRLRVKKHRHDMTTANAPLTDRLTTQAKRHIYRRRPNHHRDLPVRKPIEDKIPLRQLKLQQEATQMDEQITAETGFTGAASQPHSSHDNERVEFQMHGQKGPNSYKFGYDTGKGHNRQFRFEEKDNHGHVKGHYGYYDKDGKLQLVNYEADPEHGFKAETV
ncbi:uncharacterized protein LOC124358694 [Homalodisca vitripennis]|uniref:uncharacterized protein LOC124358694 n=1 Tax=Homalodisca vitripennis TaxID=197043 RepID=UPI001EEBEB7B|nr:uncharacterized protein LOC124358694 [Homalodisca vitripennis]